MPMPKAPLYKNHSLILRQANIRCTRQSPNMQPIAESRSMEETPNLHFRLCILAFDARHHAGSSLFVDYVGHSW